MQARQPHSQPGTGTTLFGRWVGQGYIQSTNNGGTTNSQYPLRGRFLGAAGIPALPLMGFAALAVGLAGVGARVAMRKHQVRPRRATPRARLGRNDADADTWFENVSIAPGFDRTVGEETVSTNLSIHEREPAFA